MSKTVKPSILPHKSLFLGRKDELLENFNLIEVQKNSWAEFTDVRLKEIFNEFFPIDDYTKKSLLSILKTCILVNHDMILTSVTRKS